MHKFKIHRTLGVLAVVVALVAAACGDDDATGETTVSTAAPVTTATTPAPTTDAPAPATTTEESAGGVVYTAPEAAITVDGDPSDWAEIPELHMILKPIKGEEVVEAELHDATVQVAYDADYIYMLFGVDDDFDFVEGDAKLSAAMAVAWAIDSGAGEAMGATEDDHETSLGLVDIWHWELDCAAGVESGGAVYEPGADKSPGNDSGCNFDDEYSTSPEDREDDDMAGAENSLFGVYSHTADVNGEAGTWYFEMSRPLQTGDAGDAQFVAGGTGLLALAYWDADQTPEGWEDDSHVQSTDLGWIEIRLGS